MSRDWFAEELGGYFFESGGGFGGEVAAGGTGGEAAAHGGMSVEIVVQTFGDVAALRHEGDAERGVLPDFVHEEGIVGATEDDGVDLRVEPEELVDVFLHEVVGAGVVVLVVFDEGHPHGAGDFGDDGAGVEAFDFDFVTLRTDGAFGGEDADVARGGE